MIAIRAVFPLVRVIGGVVAASIKLTRTFASWAFNLHVQLVERHVVYIEIACVCGLNSQNFRRRL